MFVGFGTAVNIATIIGGAALGVLVGARMLLRTRTLITEVLGLITILGAVSALAPMWGSRYIDALPKGWTLLAILGSLLIGGLIGSALNLESKLDSIGESLRKKFGAHEESTFQLHCSLQLDHWQYWDRSAMACRQVLINCF